MKLNLADKFFTEAIIKVAKYLKETTILMIKHIGLRKEMASTKNN